MGRPAHGSTMNANGIDYLEKIEALAALAPTLDHFIVEMEDRFVEYATETGFAVGHGYVNDPECSIQKFYASGKGTTLPLHTHKEFEYLIILEGSGVIRVDGEEEAFKKFDCLVIKPDAEHSCVFEEDTKMIAITVPSSKGYPNGKR